MDIDRDVRVAVYRFFVERGRPPVPGELAAEFGLQQRAVEDSYRRLADAHVLVLAPGSPYIWMANPLSAVPTAFPVEVGDRTFYGNCIWDALGIVAMLGGTGTTRTHCPDCGEALSIAIEQGRPSRREGVVHYGVPARRWWDQIGFT